MRGSLYLAWRYLLFEKLKTFLLIAAITLAIFIPSALKYLVHQSELQLMARAQATPLLIGAPGSPLELALNSLYFKSDIPTPMVYLETLQVRNTNLADPIPLYVRFRSRETPIVGTTLDYLELRGLRVAQGETLIRLGDCVVGAKVAIKRGLKPGDSVISSPESVFDLAGVYPLKMRVTGILAPAGSPDDYAIFTDLKTTWVMEGLAHGHDDLTQPGMASAVLKTEENRIIANASVRQFNEITDKNIDSFHFHGSQTNFPVTAIIARPIGSTVALRQKSAALLMGRYLNKNQGPQILESSKVVRELLDTVLTIQGYVLTATLGVGLGTLMTALLVFLLSLRLRRREMETMVKIGGTRTRIAMVWMIEIILVGMASISLAWLLTVLIKWQGENIIRSFMQ
jgi:putative ABC transport system permease protein